MNVTEAIKKRELIRKFKQIPVKHEDLLTIIDSARYAAYGANMQPLKFAIMENADEVYPLTRWAGYLPDWNPAEDERPLAYIAVLWRHRPEKGVRSRRRSRRYEYDADRGGAGACHLLAGGYR